MQAHIKKHIVGALFGLLLAGMVTACVKNSEKKTGANTQETIEPKPESDKRLDLATQPLQFSSESAQNPNRTSHSGSIHLVIAQPMTFETAEPGFITVSLAPVIESQNCQTPQAPLIQFSLISESGETTPVIMEEPTAVSKGLNQLVAIINNPGLCDTIQLDFFASLSHSTPPPTQPLTVVTTLEYQKYRCDQVEVRGKKFTNRHLMIETNPFKIINFDSIAQGNDATLYGYNLPSERDTFCGVPFFFVNGSDKPNCSTSPLSISANQYNHVSNSCEFSATPGLRRKTTATLDMQKHRFLKDRAQGSYRCDHLFPDGPDVYELKDCEVIYNHGPALPITELGQKLLFEAQFNDSKVEFQFEGLLSPVEIDAQINKIVSPAPNPPLVNLAWNLYSTEPMQKSLTRGYILKTFEPAQKIAFSSLSQGVLTAENRDISGNFSFPKDMKHLHLVIAVPLPNNEFAPIFNIPMTTLCKSNPENFTNTTTGEKGCP